MVRLAARRIGAVLAAEPVAELHALGLEAGRVGVGDVVRDHVHRRAAARPGARRRRCWRCPCRCAVQGWRAMSISKRCVPGAKRSRLSRWQSRSADRPRGIAEARPAAIAGPARFRAGRLADLRGKGFLNGSLSSACHERRRSSQWPQAAAAEEPSNDGRSAAAPRTESSGGKKQADPARRAGAAGRHRRRPLVQRRAAAACSA